MYFIWKIYEYFTIGSGHSREQALCQLFRCTIVPYRLVPLYIQDTLPKWILILRSHCYPLKEVHTTIALYLLCVDGQLVGVGVCWGASEGNQTAEWVRHSTLACWRWPRRTRVRPRSSLFKVSLNLMSISVLHHFSPGYFEFDPNHIATSYLNHAV